MASNTQIIEEAPSGTIDGVNKTFTIINTPITNGLSLYLNGLAQSSGIDYTLVGTTITFVDAPLVSSVILAKIIITVTVTASTITTLTLSDITDRIYKKMGIKSDSTVFDRSIVVIPKLNRVIGDICAGQVTNILNPSITYKAGFLRFLARKYFFRTVTPVKLTADTSGAIEFDTTNFSSSGYVMINEDVIYYSGKTSTSITGVTGLSYTHDEGSVVEQVFVLPDDAGKNFNLWNIDTKETNPIKFQDDRAQKDFSPYWTIKFDSTQDKEFIYVHNINNTNFVMDYYAKSIDLVEDTDESVLPDTFMEGVTIPLTAGILLYSQYGEDVLGVRGRNLIQDGYHSLQSLYGQSGERVKEFRKTVKRPSWNNRSFTTTNED